MFSHLVGNERLGGLDQTQLPLDQGKEIKTLSKHTGLATQLRLVLGEKTALSFQILLYTLSTEIGGKKSIKESQNFSGFFEWAYLNPVSQAVIYI